MPDDLRSKLIRLATTMPKKSSERTALLKVLASEVEFAGSAPENYKKRFADDLSKIAGNAGRLTYLRFDDPRAGGGWTAIFDTEFAALRVYYEWRKVNGINLGKAVTPGGGWYVSRIT